MPNLFTRPVYFVDFILSSLPLKNILFRRPSLFWLPVVFDGLDGRIARLTNTTSKFGAEYDSLSDVIAFGVAPSLLAYSWAMSIYGKWGWIVAFLFVLCGALRLARYNIQIGMIESKVFNGLPIPAAASVVATTVIFFRLGGSGRKVP